MLLATPAALLIAVVAADGGAAHPLHGTWKLDLAASSDVTEVVAHFDAGFLIRAFAKSAAPTNVITWGGDRFELKVQVAAVTRVTTIVLDGKTETRDELFGNPYSYTSTLDGDAVVSRGCVTVKGGGCERLELRRHLEPNGMMALDIDLFPDKGPTLHLKRAFTRVAK